MHYAMSVFSVVGHGLAWSRSPFSDRLLGWSNSFSTTFSHPSNSNEAQAIQRGPDRARQAAKSHRG